MRFFPCLPLFCLGLLALPASAQDVENEESVPGEEENLPFGLGWLDETQAIASERANSVADQIDRFFGAPRSDLEAAYSSLRLTVINSWSEIEGVESDLRLRGRVHLPRLNERLSLIFSEDEGDGSSYYQRGGITQQTQQDTRVNLEFNFFDRVRDRLDFRLGMSSSLKGRVSARYRHEHPFGDDWLHRFTETVYFKDGGPGFGSLTRYQLEKQLSDTALFRWDNDVKFEESFDGSEWNSSLNYITRRSDSTGVIYYVRISGLTDPDYLAAHDIGVRIRRNIYRPWLFVEVEPGYTWQKEADDLPREESPFIFVRFEMAIGRLDN